MKKRKEINIDNGFLEDVRFEVNFPYITATGEVLEAIETDLEKMGKRVRMHKYNTSGVCYFDLGYKDQNFILVLNILLKREFISETVHKELTKEFNDRFNLVVQEEEEKKRDPHWKIDRTYAGYQITHLKPVYIEKINVQTITSSKGSYQEKEGTCHYLCIYFLNEEFFNIFRKRHNIKKPLWPKDLQLESKCMEEWKKIIEDVLCLEKAPEYIYSAFEFKILLYSLERRTFSISEFTKMCASGEFLERSAKAAKFDISENSLLCNDTDLPFVSDKSVFVKPLSPKIQADRIQPSSVTKNTFSKFKSAKPSIQEDVKSINVSILNITIAEFNEAYKGKYSIIKGEGIIWGQFWLLIDKSNIQCGVLMLGNNELIETPHSIETYDCLNTIKQNRTNPEINYKK